MSDQSSNKPSMLQQKSRQFIDERVDLLDTIREMVGSEIDKRMAEMKLENTPGPSSSEARERIHHIDT